MIQGSAAGCLRNPARVPKNLSVSWDDGYVPGNDVDHNGPLLATSSSLDRPIHSMERCESCSFEFEALGDASWMAALTFFQDAGDELQQFARLLSSPQPQTMMISPPLARCSLNLLDDEPCTSIHDRLHLMQQPRSSHILYRLLHEQGIVEFTDEGPVLYVMSWFLHGERRRSSNAPRRIRLDRWFMNWQNDIRQTWIDRMDADQPFDVYVVFHAMPQHPNFDEHLHIIVVQRPRHHDRAALFACLFAGNDERVIGITLTARLCAPLLGYDELVQHFEVVPHCSFRDCAFMSDDTFIHFGSPVRMLIRHGLCIQGRVGPVPPDDVVDLMQTWASDPLDQDMLRMTQLMPQWEHPIPAQQDQHHAQDDNADAPDTPDPSHDDGLDIDDLVTDHDDDERPSDHLYRKTHGHRVTRLDDVSYENMLLDAAQVWNRPPETVIDLFQTAVTPERLASDTRCFITEFEDDRTNPHTDKLLLVDVEFYFDNPQSGALRDRRVRVLPALLSRFRLLHTCHVSHHCMLEDDRCIVFFNHEPWKLQDLGFKRVHDGDYIRILLPPSQMDSDTVHLVWTRQKRIHPELVTEDERGSCSEEDEDADHSSMFQCHDLQLSDDEITHPAVLILDAEPLQPMPALVPHDPAFHNDLHYLWEHDGAVESVEEGRVLYVHTWFLNHESYPLCQQSRTVRLGPNPTLWFAQLTHEWRDLYNPAQAVHWNIVQPGPPAHAWDTTNPIHILIQQQRLPSFASILISMMDNSAEYPRWISHARALTGPIFKSLLIAMLHLDTRCHPALSPIQCVLLHGHHSLDDDTLHYCEHGQGFLLILNDLMVRRAHAAQASIPDHPQDDDVSMLQRLGSSKLSLELDALIPVEPQTRIPCADLCFLRGQVLSMDLGPVHGYAQVVKWHTTTQTALDTMPPWRGETAVHYAFFTDGTAIPGHTSAASSVILVVYTLSGPRFGGFRTALIQSQPTSARAEAGAILLATLWALQLARGHPYHLASLDFSFTFDSLFAGRVASGAWKPKAHVDILHPARALVLWLTTIPGCHIDWHHVPSHSGHPYNEAADAACWAAICSWIPAIDIEPLLNIISFDGVHTHLVDWLWMLEATLHGAPGLPRLSRFEFVADIQQPFAQEPDVTNHPFMIRESQSATTGVLEHHDFDFRCATANVLTLFAAEQRAGAYISGRQEALMQTCQAAGLHCIGLQETRSRLDGHVATEAFHILSAPASVKGTGGVQLWVARTWHAQGAHVRISHADLRILHSSAQRLIVRIACPAVKLVVLVLHAPSSADEMTLTQWWAATSSAVPSTYRSWPWIVLADANARLGQHPSPLVGPAGAQEDNIAGTIFQEWLHNHSIALPQTFDAFHQDHVHTTWVHGNGAEARLDYVGLSSDLAHDDMRTYVGEIDLAIHRTDHRMVSLTLPWTLWRPQCKPSSGSIPDAPPASQLPVWQDDVHTHASFLQQWAVPLCLPSPSESFTRSILLTLPGS